MNSYTFVCLVSLFAVALSLPSEHYTDKYDNINVDEIIANDRVLTSFIKCVLDQGKCSPEGRTLKGHVSDALQTECSKCTRKQKSESEKVIKHLMAHQPAAWEQLKNKYDPSKKYITKYERKLKEVRA